VVKALCCKTVGRRYKTHWSEFYQFT
jgi:hypothetical protein